MIKFEISNRIGTLTISRPESLNALNSSLLEALDQTLSEIAGQSLSDLRCLIVTGAGEKAFVAGADIKEMSDLTSQQAENFAKRGQSVFQKLEDLQIPVIAAVNGFALGGGLELALSCDFIYASATAKLGLPEVTLGLIPGFGGTVRLSRRVGFAKAKEIIFSGNMMTADEALQYGVVNKVLASAELMPAVRKLAETIASRSPVAIAAAKQSVHNAFDQDLIAAIGNEARIFGGVFNSADSREGTKAFIEKRKAEFNGK